MNLTQQQFLPPSGLPRFLAEASDFWKRGDYQQAAQALERAHQLRLSDEKILLDLGMANAMNYDFAAAERFFENAIRVAPSKTDALMVVGQNWRKLRHFEAARHCFERVLQQSHFPIPAIFKLAEIYERLRCPEKSEELIDRALQLDGADGGALFARAEIYCRKRQWEDAEKLFRSILAKSQYRILHAATWNELGRIFDQQGHYDQAWAAFLEGKALSILEAAPATAKLRVKQASAQQIQQTISEKTVQAWRNFGEVQMRPARKLAVLCGHARSGTTLLEYVLDSHPQIVSADETFVFFNKVHSFLSRSLPTPPPVVPLLDSMSGIKLRQIRSEYLRGIQSFLGQNIGDRLLLEKNPGLTSDLAVFLRVFPESKFLVALRDPRDVCLSCFMQNAVIGTDSSSWLSLEGTVNNYASIMGFWLAMKPLLGAAALEVRYEDMVENLESNARRTLEFLGCSWDERVLRFDEHARNKIVRSPTYVEVSKPIYKTAVGRWQNYQKYFDPHQAKLAPFLSAFGYQ